MHLNVTCALLRKGLAFVSKWKIYQKIIYGYHLKIYFVTNQKIVNILDYSVPVPSQLRTV